MSKIDKFNELRGLQKEIRAYHKWSILPTGMRCFSDDGRETNFENYASGLAAFIKKVGFENQAKLGMFFKKIVDEFLDKEIDAAAKDAESEALEIIQILKENKNDKRISF